MSNSLVGKRIGGTTAQFLQSPEGFDGTLRQVRDGLGNGLPMRVSTTAVQVDGAFDAEVTATGTPTARTLSARAGDIANLRDFGAVGDDTTDDTAAVMAWWAAAMATGCGYIPPGFYRCASSLVWDLGNLGGRGFHIMGAGIGRSEIRLQATAGATWQLIRSGTSIASFFGTMEGFRVTTAVEGVGARIGRADNTGGFNTVKFSQIECKNVLDHADAVALSLHGVFNCHFDGIVCNTGGNGDRVLGEYNGTALQFVKGSFNHFSACSFANAKIATHLTSDFVFGNTFTATDWEECETALVVDSTNAANNTFIGGTVVALVGFHCTAGVRTLVINPNIGLYSGGVLTDGVVGLRLWRPGVGVATPAMPASGDVVTNTTARAVAIVLRGGTVTAVVANGATMALTGGTFLIPAGGTISITYSATPAWTWFGTD